MDALNIAGRLRQCARDLPQFTPASLSAFFGVPSRHFNQTEPGGPIFVHPADLASPSAYLLRGAIFWPDNKQIVRGHPRIFPTSDYSGEPFEIAQELLLAQAAHEGDLIAEPKLYGATIRVYKHESDLYCATDVSHDGGNPLVGAGIDNTAGLGIDYGSQAASLLSSRYPRIERLARLDYVTVFALQLPEFAPDQSVDQADLILVDVIDPDQMYVDRLEKERIADDYGLKIVGLAAKITVQSRDPMAVLRRCRALEHQAAQAGSAGFILKGKIGDSDEGGGESSDQLFCKVEPPSERDRSREVTAADLSAVTEEITGQFGDGIWSDEPFVEGLFLEYLGSRHRTVRWRVEEYLSAWRQARRFAGLA